MTRFVYVILLMLADMAASGKGYRIEIRLGSATDQPVYLAHYFGENVFIDDTVRTDSEGYGIFRRDTLLPQGLYKIYLDKDNHFDFMLGADQTLKITNPAFTMDRLKIEGAVESVEFLTYMKWLKEQQQKLGPLDSAMKNASDSEKREIELQIRELTYEVTAYWKKKSAQYPGTFLAAFLMANYFEELKPEDIPEQYSVNDSLKWVYQYNYRKSHFFDFFDITDERFLFTPLIKSKLDTYLEKVLLQMYDSVKPSAYRILEQVESQPKVFRFVTSYLLNSSLNSRVMGMDALFVDIARDYYFTGRAAWADSATLAKVRENVIFLEHNLIGQTARDISMETFEGQPFRLYQQNSPYTVLVFFEPDCSHCNEFVPKLYNEIYLPYRDRGLEVIAGYTMNDKKDWADFIEKFNLTDWINIWDEHHVSRFKIIYDTRTTPSVYLLDKDKKIIAKKFSIDFLKNYLKHFLGNNNQGDQ